MYNRKKKIHYGIKGPVCRPLAMTTVVKIVSRRTSEKCHFKGSDTDDIEIQYESHKVHSLRGAFAFLAIDTTLIYV